MWRRGRPEGLAEAGGGVSRSDDAQAMTLPCRRCALSIRPEMLDRRDASPIHKQGPLGRCHRCCQREGRGVGSGYGKRFLPHSALVHSTRAPTRGAVDVVDMRRRCSRLVVALYRA